MRLDEMGVARWQHDLWYRIVEAALAGHPAQVDLNLPGFDAPTASRYAATRPDSSAGSIATAGNPP
jgi:hypothetical protein